MTDKHKRFCEYYLQTLDVQQASKLAGYTEKTGNRLLKDINIQEYIEQSMENKTLKNIADCDEVMKCLTDIMRGEDILQDEGKTAKGISVKERLKAAELLGKVYSIFTPKQESLHNDTVIILGNNEILD